MPYADGTMIQVFGQPEVDLMQNGQRRWLLDSDTLACMGLNWDNIQHITAAEWNSIPQGPPIPSRKNGTVLCGSGPKVYVVEGCQLHWIPDPQTLQQQYGGWGKVDYISDADLSAIPVGAPITSVESEVWFSFDWFGGVFSMGHNVVAKIVAIGSDLKAIYAFLMSVAAAGGVVGAPMVAAIGVVASYVALELTLVASLDHNNGVNLTLPYLAMWAGQWWLIIPSSR
jgi:hypothetical protein